MLKFARKTLVYVLILALLISSCITTAFGLSVSDIDGHWAEAKIQKWLDNKYVQGYGDGTFRPNNKITRAEFIKMINNSMLYTEITDITFEDVKPSDWFYKDVQIAKKMAYINGYSAKLFKPNDYITREEAAKIIVTIKGIDSNADAAKVFTDYDKISTWATGFVGAAADAKFVTGYPDKTFRPLNNLTRAEALIMLDNALLYVERPEGGSSYNGGGSNPVVSVKIALKDNSGELKSKVVPSEYTSSDTLKTLVDKLLAFSETDDVITEFNSGVKNKIDNYNSYVDKFINKAGDEFDIDEAIKKQKNAVIEKIKQQESSASVANVTINSINLKDYDIADTQKVNITLTQGENILYSTTDLTFEELKDKSEMYTIATGLQDAIKKEASEKRDIDLSVLDLSKVYNNTTSQAILSKAYLTTLNSKSVQIIDNIKSATIPQDYKLTAKVVAGTNNKVTLTNVLFDVTYTITGSEPKTIYNKTIDSVEAEVTGLTSDIVLAEYNTSGLKIYGQPVTFTLNDASTTDPVKFVKDNYNTLKANLSTTLPTVGNELKISVENRGKTFELTIKKTH